MNPLPGKNVCLMLLLVFGLAACASNPSNLSNPSNPLTPEIRAAVDGDGPGDPALIHREEPVVRNLPKSRGGNRPQYTVFDQTYRVLDTARDFKEWGAATWYGEKFHGRATASGEIYDMYNLTAAHRHLPLPTFVRVTRIDNNRSVVVKVNDRGPFVDERVIDLSYAAAVKLGMIQDGTAEVYIEALSSHEGAVPEQLVEVDDDTGPSEIEAARFVAVKGGNNTQSSLPSVQSSGQTQPLVRPAERSQAPLATVIQPATEPTTGLANPAAPGAQANSAPGYEAPLSPSADQLPAAASSDNLTAIPAASNKDAANTREPSMPLLHFVQLGAFGERQNAERLMSRLNNETDLPVVVSYDTDKALFLVRVGPMSNSDTNEQALDALFASGFNGYAVQAPLQ
ncbi:MAG: septal ring lytic transglycosylase RlpA family protein [Granulosicoccus sp.]|nr:septal ring lytic transglycosylase RlpA family protein [Granulosicoccus sp.]